MSQVIDPSFGTPEMLRRVSPLRRLVLACCVPLVLGPLALLLARKFTSAEDAPFTAYAGLMLLALFGYAGTFIKAYAARRPVHEWERVVSHLLGYTGTVALLAVMFVAGTSLLGVLGFEAEGPAWSFSLLVFLLAAVSALPVGIAAGTARRSLGFTSAASAWLAVLASSFVLVAVPFLSGGWLAAVTVAALVAIGAKRSLP